MENMEKTVSDKIAASEILSRIVDFLFPRRCLLCGKVNPDGKYLHFCERCSPEADILRGARCLRCSEIVGTEGIPDTPTCARCRDDPPWFNKSLVVGSFTNAVRQMSIELKYRNGTYILADMSRLLAEVRPARAFFDKAVLVPVPLHYSRKLKRGYNQSELICRMIAKTFPDANLRIAKILKRIRRTPTQTTLNREHRAGNVRNAFALSNKKTAKAAFDKATRFVVVDDVMTSSATLSECAKTLKRAGFKNVDAFAFARRL